MAISLYDLTVPSFQQTLGALAGVLDKGLKHLTEKGVDPQSIVDARLTNDMLPLAFQVRSVAHHSVEAIKGARAGVAHPPGQMPAMDYAGLQKIVADALAALATETPDAVNAIEGTDVVFKLGDFKIPFVAENFLMSFSMPNFYFHATTAYDILRVNGVPLGKRDFLGHMRMET